MGKKVKISIIYRDLRVVSSRGLEDPGYSSPVGSSLTHPYTSEPFKNVNVERQEATLIHLLPYRRCSDKC